MKVLVRGVGLLGTSLGLALTEIGVEVFLEDVDARAVATATGMGAGSSRVRTRIWFSLRYHRRPWRTRLLPRCDASRTRRSRMSAA